MKIGQIGHFIVGSWQSVSQHETSELRGRRRRLCDDTHSSRARMQNTDHAKGFQRNPEFSTCVLNSIAGPINCRARTTISWIIAEWSASMWRHCRFSIWYEFKINMKINSINLRWICGIGKPRCMPKHVQTPLHVCFRFGLDRLLIRLWNWLKLR